MYYIKVVTNFGTWYWLNETILVGSLREAHFFDNHQSADCICEKMNKEKKGQAFYQRKKLPTK